MKEILKFYFIFFSLKFRRETLFPMFQEDIFVVLEWTLVKKGELLRFTIGLVQFM